MADLAIDPQRIMSKIQETPTGCWQWTGSQDGRGYSRIHVNRRHTRGHRVSWETFVGPIPEGMEIDHLCRNRLCVNPAHLEPVTHKVNTLRGETIVAKNLAKTHCPDGHEYDEANTKIYRGKRYCRACHRRYVAEHKARKRAASA